MQPIAITLPAGTASSRALMRAFHLGHCRIARRRRPDETLTPRRKQHLEGLLALLQRLLLNAEPPTSTLWIDRRELGDILLLLDHGLCALREDGSQSESTVAAIEAADRFLFCARQFTRTPKRPMHSSKPAPAALAAGA